MSARPPETGSAACPSDHAGSRRQLSTPARRNQANPQSPIAHPTALRTSSPRAEARAQRLHLVGLTNAAVIIMGVVLGAMVVLVLVLVSHH